MDKVQEIFNRIKERSVKQRDIKAIYRDALASSHEYQLIIEELKKLKEKKKSIEASLQGDFVSEFNELDGIKTDIASDKELLNDATLNKIIRGEMIEVEDEHHNKYEPVFSVKFKKT
jgi:hypothetical protein